MPDFRGPVRGLTSFAFFRDMDLEGLRELLTEDRPPSLVADSGAFSAYTQGWEVTARDYAAWLRRWGHVFDYCFTLDIINDVEGTWRSHRETQELAGRRLVPVVHLGAPMSVFDRYREEHALIGLGGLALPDRSRKLGRRYRWLIEAFRWAEKNDCRFHGLGVGSFRYIWELPWWSVDSSSWSFAMQHATTLIFDNGRMRKVFRTGAQAHKDPVARIIRERGLEPRFIARDFNRYIAGSLSADSYRRAEAWIRGRRGIIPPPTGQRDALDEGEGLRIYLALVMDNDAAMLVGSTDALSRGGMSKRWVPIS